VDASAILAILLAESDAALFAEALLKAARRYLSPVNYLEAAIVFEIRGSVLARRTLDVFLEEADIQVGEVTASQARIAREAYRDFGKGVHPAGLNLADCFAYAMAKELRMPLLYKGEDFSKTDIRAALG